jgi:large subunit ribosomal protein L31
MKAETHPTYFSKASVVCACGNKFAVGSTKEDLSVSICSSCHPFYTGNERTVDTAGRIDRFKKRMEKTVKSRAK